MGIIAAGAAIIVNGGLMAAVAQNVTGASDGAPEHNVVGIHPAHSPQGRILTMEEAVQRCWFWMDQERIKVVYPDDNSLKRAQLWISMHKLGRKRIQDTHMASAFASNGVSEIITANPDDFRIFDAFDLSEY